MGHAQPSLRKKVALLSPVALMLACALLAARSRSAAGEAIQIAPSRSHEPSEVPRQVRVGDGTGKTLVARVYGAENPRVVLLPDGRLGFSNALIPTEEPFVPLGIDELRKQLEEGEYRGFAVVQSKRYLVFTKGSGEFAHGCARLLESLLSGLSDWFRARGVPARAPEFPLVAVIFRTEREFRAHRAVDPDVQAYYDVISNRIYLYEHRDREIDPPEVVVRRKPQTVAHEGAHQVLQNIGIQPRLADWPAWLAEGLAEFFAPTETRDGRWAGISQQNPFHLATLRDEAEVSAFLGRMTAPFFLPPYPRTTPIEELLSKDRLSPSDYARSWALVNYLMAFHEPRFMAYLSSMSRTRPLRPRSQAQQLQDFRAAITPNLPALQGHLIQSLQALPMPEPTQYFAVSFEQVLADGSIRFGTLVSPSPAVVQEWLAEMADPDGFAPAYDVTAWARRWAAIAAMDRWLESR
jgi:hypothetical protein